MLLLLSFTNFLCTVLALHPLDKAMEETQNIFEIKVDGVCVYIYIHKTM